MIRGYWLLWCAALSSVAASGCVYEPAINLRLSEVTSDRAAIFGHFKIVNEGRTITDGCRVGFTRDTQADQQLDDTGWVFTTVPPGPTSLYHIICGTPGGAGFTVYETERLAFQVPGNGRITYFGHIQIDMQHKEVDQATMFAGALAGAVMGAAISGMATGGNLSPEAAAAGAEIGANASVKLPVSGKHRPDGTPFGNADIFGAVVENRLQEAVIEYQRRFEQEAAALKPVAALAGPPSDAFGVLASAAAPTSALGFPFGQDPATAEARCTGASLTWQKLDGGGFSCSGAAVDLGVPMTVKLTACAGKLCEIVADAGADGVPWSTLVERFDKLVGRLAREHGNTHERKRRALEGCTSGPKACTAAGQMLLSETWRWSDNEQVALVLDGAASGGTPTLRIVYRTGAYFVQRP